MNVTIQIILFASLARYLSDNRDAFPIEPGETVQSVVQRLGVPLESARLIFVDGIKRDLSTALSGGERVAVFPPVGGG
jgi:molybdopterin converting factor small subunit